MSVKAKAKQTGFVSIIVASLLMIILALITVGFTRLMQREQRQSIDRQLSRQALYAAEAGVNDVAAAITAGTPGYTNPTKTDCDPSALPSSNLSGDGVVAVTCALFNEQPGALEYDIGSDNSKIVEFRTASTNNFDSLNVTWGREGITNSVDNNIGSLPPCVPAGSVFEYPATRPGVVPILKFDLTSVVGGNYDRNSLLQNTDYLYLVPCDGAGVGSHAFDVASRGNAVAVPCSGTDLQPCSVDITGLAPASNKFFGRIRPIFENSSVSITATEDIGAGVGPAQFIGAQVGIDVTARAGDVVRRLRANVPLSTSGDVPEFALQSFEGICKRLDVINEVTPGAQIVDECNPLPPPPDPPPPGPVPSGDGYSATAVAGRMYNMFHHRQGVIIVCHETDLSYCAGREWFENNQFYTPQHSNMVEHNGLLYYSAQGFPANGGPANTFGIGCFNPALNRDCGFTALGTTNHVSRFPFTPNNDFTAGIDNIVRLNNRIYTIAIDNVGANRLYCFDPVAGSPCAGFTPYNTGASTVPNTVGAMQVGFSLDGNRILFSMIATAPAFRQLLGCYDTVTQTRCAGWSSDTVTNLHFNTLAIRVGNSYCVYRESQPANPAFEVDCVDIANGNSVAPPPNFLTQPKPSHAVQPGVTWKNWDPYYDGSRIYIGATSGSVTDVGSVYCYDTATSNVCAGWGGDNGWQDGSSSGNDFSGLEIYTVARVGACLYGIGDNAGFPPTGMARLSPVDAGPC